MSQLAIHPASPSQHELRAAAFRDGINQIRAVAHEFIDAELFGALDETTRLIQDLERKYSLFISGEDVQLPAAKLGRKGHRGVGIDVRPGSVQLARMGAALSLRELAEGHLTRQAIFLIEKGKCRPSMKTLQLIASRTGKPLAYFVEDGSA